MECACVTPRPKPPATGAFRRSGHHDMMLITFAAEDLAGARIA